jgi:hypothetical protein
MIDNLPCITLSSLAGAVLVWVLIDLVVKPYIKKEILNLLKKGHDDEVINGDVYKAHKDNYDKKYLVEFGLFSFVSGFFEIFMYSISIFILKPEFIILWVGIKTALRWDREKSSGEENKFIIKVINAEKRGVYYCFLIGNALTIIIGFFIAYHLNPNIY